MDRSSNPRGVVRIEFPGGMELELRPSFNVYAAIEERIGSVPKVMSKIEEGSIVAAATVIWAGITNGGTERAAYTIAQIGDLLLEHGLNMAIAPCIRFIAHPLRGLASVAEEKTSAPADSAKSDG